VAEVRVLVADDDAVFLECIKAALSTRFQVITTCDYKALRRTAVKLQADVILTHFETASADGFQAVKDVFQCLPGARVVFYSGADNRDAGNVLTSSGMVSAVEGCGFISEQAPTGPGTVLANFKSESGNGRDVGGDSFPDLESESAPTSREVTSREYEVLALLAAGHPMKHIAYRLGITYRTVTFHKYRMMERLGITTNAGLMAYAIKRNVTSSVRQDGRFEVQ
jgi:DNA-binding NarL/FixJ family response regulator